VGGGHPMSRRCGGPCVLARAPGAHRTGARSDHIVQMVLCVWTIISSALLVSGCAGDAERDISKVGASRVCPPGACLFEKTEARPRLP
jgi:hypothetical protein